MQTNSSNNSRLNNKKGVALLIAIFSLGIMMFLAMEVSYETNVEYVVAAQKVNRLKAYYAAKAGVELSLLRVLLYKKAIASFGDQLGDQKSMLDPIWNFPFAWPPSKFIPQDDATRITKDSIKSVEKEAAMEATYITSIESEGGKIDINDLGSDIEGLRKSVRAQILQIFAQEIENSDEFADKYSAVNFDELLNNVQDWVDEDKESLNGGDEKRYYSDLLKDNPSDFIPPNQPFKTMEELHMVSGMRDDFYNLLKNRVTVYGIKGVNINYASADILKSLDKLIDDKVAQEIISRRNDPQRGGLFAKEEDFLEFLGTLINTNNFNEAGVPLLFDPVYNFRINVTGEFARAVSEITVITVDFDNLAPRVAELLDKQDEEKNGNQDSQDQTNQDQQNNNQTNQGQGQGQSPGTANNKTKKTIPKGRPRIVYWQET